MIETSTVARCDVNNCKNAELVKPQMALPDCWASIEMHVQRDSRNVEKILCPEHAAQFLEWFLSR